MHTFTSAYIARVTTPKMGQCPKGYWLMEFPQHPSVFHYRMQQVWSSAHYIKDENMKISQENYMIQVITVSSI